MVEPLAAVRGQDRAVSVLFRYLESGNVPPGLLFFGEEGIGKEKAALAFVAALFCRSRGAGGACGTCPDCRLLSSGAHPNLLRVSPPPDKESIPIQSVRELQEELALKAFSDRPRAALVVPADRMTVQAANALLKTLEEPPSGTHVLLVAHRLSQLPPTIVSRCQKLPFSPLPLHEVEAILLSGAAAGGKATAEAVRAAAACSGGSPGRAAAALDEDPGERALWIRLLSGGDPAAVTRAAASWKGAGPAAARVAVPLSILRDLALLSSGANAAIMNGDYGEALAAAARRMTPVGWTRALRDLLAMSRMPPQAQKPLMLEAFLFGLRGKD